MRSLFSNIRFLFFTTAVIFIFYGCDNGTSNDDSNISELEGTWSGEYIMGSTTIPITHTYTGNTVVITMATQQYYTATFEINKNANPKQFDGLITECVNPDYIGKTSLAIYKISNDTLTMAGNEPGITVRPTSFTSGGNTALMVMKKQ